MSEVYGVAAAPGALDLRISNEKSQIGVATRLDAERDALRPSSLLGGMHLPSGYAAVKMAMACDRLMVCKTSTTTS